MNQSADEFSLIRTIDAIIGHPGPRVQLGIGDDAAILKTPSGKMLFCSDAMVEGIHFDLAYTSAKDLGHKALASCLSDIAAMNGTPLYAVLSLALPAHHGDEFLKEFYTGAIELARPLQVDIVGGDLSSSKNGIFIDVACVGECSHPITRRGARPGDLLAVSGFPGSAAAGLYVLQNLSKELRPDDLCRAHLRPVPRFDLLPALASGIGTSTCTSLIDVSDGLSSELHHLAKQSNVGFRIDAQKIPLAPQARALAATIPLDPLSWALNGGEDYELLATFDATKGLPDSRWTVIGSAVSAELGVTLCRADGSSRLIEARGYRHFTSS